MIDLSIAVDTDTPLTHDEARTYCLNQGTGIYYTSKGREVEEIAIDWLLNHPRPHQARETVRRNLDLIDFDEWQAIESVLLANDPDCDTSELVSLATAFKINNALWEDLEMSPMDLESSYAQRTTDMYKLELTISCKDENGNFVERAKGISAAADTIEELNESVIERLIWGAIGFYTEFDNTEVIVHKLITKCGEYIGSDEFAIRTSVVRVDSKRFSPVLRDLSSFEIVE